MKKIVSLLLTIAMILSMSVVLTTVTSAADAWDGTSAAEGYESGTGTEADPYKIKTAAQLKYLADQVNAGAYSTAIYVRLENDIDLGSNEWTAIGNTTATAFKGEFDGNGHTISNFKITSAPAGFFGYAGTATIKGLTLDSFDIICSDSWFAAGMVSNVQEKAQLTFEKCVLGENATITVDYTPTDGSNKAVRIGGFLGDCATGVLFNATNCITKAKIVVKNAGINACNIGSFCGSYRGGNVTNCANFGSIVVEYDGEIAHHAGGIVGFVNIQDNITGKIENVISGGNITGKNTAGAVVGFVHTVKSKGSFTISNAFVTAESFTGTDVATVIGTFRQKTGHKCTIGNVTVVGMADVPAYNNNTQLGDVAVTSVASVDALKDNAEYNAILEVLGLKEVKPADPEANSTLTIEQAIALGQTKEHDTFTEGKYYVTGTIKEVVSTKYGNMTITDGTNDLYIYGVYSADGETRYDAMETKPVAGDTVTLYGVIGNYNGAQMESGWMTAHTPAEKPDEPEVPDEPEKPTLPDNIEIENKVNANVVIGDFATNNSWENSKQYTEIKIDDITVAVSGTPVGSWGLNTGKYYTSNNSWRVYQNENPSIVFTAPEGKAISSVKITYKYSNGGILLAGEEQIESDELFNVNDTTLTLGVGSNTGKDNGNVQIQSITVVYGDLVIPEPINPETGDNTLAYVIALAAVIVIASAAVVVIRKKENA